MMDRHPVEEWAQRRDRLSRERMAALRPSRRRENPAWWPWVKARLQGLKTAVRLRRPGRTHTRRAYPARRIHSM